MSSKLSKIIKYLLLSIILLILLLQIYSLFFHSISLNISPPVPTYNQIIKQAKALQAFKSQGEQDIYLFNHLFKDNPYYNRGFFIEFGARDGIEHSNTYFYEKVLGWHGILAEAYTKELKNIRLNRSKSAILTAAISDRTEGNQPFIGGVIEGWGGLIASYDKSRLSNLRSDQSKEEVHIQTFELRNLLEIFGVHHINYMSIDTEGSELNALKSFPWDKIRCDVIGVEVLLDIKPLPLKTMLSPSADNQLMKYTVWTYLGSILYSAIRLKPSSSLLKVDKDQQKVEDASRKEKHRELIEFMISKGYKVYKFYQFAEDTADIFFVPKYHSWYTGKQTFDQEKFFNGRKICQHLQRCA